MNKLLSIFAGILQVFSAHSQTSTFEKTLSFNKNIIAVKNPELVCHLSEEGILLKDVVQFTFLNDTSFVVLDGRGVYLYHISGTFKKQLGNKGQAGGEMITPSCIYATSDFVYIWCSSLMKFLVFDHEANFKKELSGFKKAVKKFVVNSSNETMYLYTSGYFNESENKIIDVIDVYNIADKTSKKYGERDPEDEVLSTFINSGGLCVNMDQFIYLHPGNLIIHVLNYNSNKTVRYKIDDKTFHTTTINSSIRDVMESRRKLTDYLHNNSIVRGFYNDSGQFVIVSEIGQYDFNQQSRVMNTQNRKIKLYVLDSSFNPNCTILFDYIISKSIVVYSGSMYFITTELTDDDQLISLKRFPLFEK
jgi:hypothetical protein